MKAKDKAPDYRSATREANMAEIAEGRSCASCGQYSHCMAARYVYSDELGSRLCDQWRSDESK